MGNSRLISLLDEKREDIMSEIELAIIDSYMPNFQDVYDLYINEEDGRIFRFETEEDEPVFQCEEEEEIICLPDEEGAVICHPEEEDGEDEEAWEQEDLPTLTLLYRVKNHSGGEKHFARWLSDAGIEVCENDGGTKLKRLYPKEYQQFWEENKQDGMRDIANIEKVFDSIKAIYQLCESLG